MGYHVTILRTHQGREVPIDSKEVRGLAESLRSAKIAPCSLNDGELDLVISRDSGSDYRFALQRGRLWTKNPEDDEIRVMIDIASKLGARVRGDELETFRTPTDTYFHPDDRPEIQEADEFTRDVKKAARRKQWTLNLVLIVIFASLAAMAMYFT